MKTILKTSLAAVLLFAFSLTTSSFSSRKGGEGFEIYLNNKLVLQQFGSQLNYAKSFELDESYSNSHVTVRYYHCGRVGLNRDITIRDVQNKILKEWRYQDGKLANPAMDCPVKDILSVQNKNTGNSLRLFYSSSELPNGRMLANIFVKKEKARTIVR